MMEFLDVVDHNDRVLCQQLRTDIHRDRLLHRAVSVWVHDGQGRLWIQQRSAQKSQEPLLYSPTASGHVDAGESYDEAAPRELNEEAGLMAPLRRLTILPATTSTGWEFTAIYWGISRQTPRPCDTEVVAMRAVTARELSRWFAREPEVFSTSFRTTYQWLCQHHIHGQVFPC